MGLIRAIDSIWIVDAPRSAALGLAHRLVACRATMTSFCGLRRRPSTSSTSRPRFGTRSAFRCRATSLESLSPRGGRATILVEPAALPLPGAPQDARKSAIAATIEELERCGVPDERQTILVAGGLGRRFAQRDLERLLPPSEAREFRGRVVVHDAEDEALVGLGRASRIHPDLVETDLVLTVTAAETVLHGGPGALIAACDAATIRGSSRGRLAARGGRLAGLASRARARSCRGRRAQRSSVCRSYSICRA